MSPGFVPARAPALDRMLGAAILESNSATFTTVADITGLYLPAFFPGLESFEVSFSCGKLSGSTAWSVQIVDVDTAAIVGLASGVVASPVICRGIIPPGKASASYKVRALSTTGTGTIEASLTNQAILKAVRL